VAVLDFVSKKFGTNLTDAGVIYVWKMEIGEEGVTRYRIGFQSASGVYYEVTVVFVESSSPPILLKYVKLYDGYSLLPQNSSEAAAAIQFYQSALQQQVEEANLSDFQI
jgi:hypothetical protein